MGPLRLGIDQDLRRDVVQNNLQCPTGRPALGNFFPPQYNHQEHESKCDSLLSKKVLCLPIVPSDSQFELHLVT
jgi:hypothetical protein